MTVEFAGTAHDDTGPSKSRPPWLVLASGGLWLGAAALLVLAATRTVWTYETSWPTGNGVTSGRVTIAYDAWGTPVVTNLSEFQTAGPPLAVPWAPLLLVCGWVLAVAAIVQIAAGSRRRAGVIVLGLSLVMTGAVVAVGVAASLAQATFRTPMDYAGISPGQSSHSSNGPMLAVVLVAAVMTVTGTCLAVVGHRGIASSTR